MSSPVCLIPPVTLRCESPLPISADVSLRSGLLDELEKPPNDSDPWEVCNFYAKRHIQDICESWRDEVDKLLIFAGLFSGVVTSFAIESYGSVKEDPAETTVLLLKTMIRQLDNITNPQRGALIDDPLPDPSSHRDRRINTCWFLSLALSLSTVMAGILCLQWLREFGRNANVPHRENVALHHMHYEGMKEWHVFRILNALPILLIAALLLFFVGFVEFLWEVDSVGAILLTTVVAIAFVFILTTALLPTLQCLYICIFPNARFTQCPYKSPQAWMFQWMLQKFMGLLSYFADWCKSTGEVPEGGRFTIFRDLSKVQNWRDYDHFLRRRRDTTDKRHTLDVGYGLAWVGETFVQHQKLVDAVCRCLRDLDPRVALEASLARLSPRRADSVRQVQSKRPPWGDATHPRRSKVLFDQDLILSHALEHFAEKIEQAHMSPSLLQQRVDLFLKINEVEGVDFDVECPVNHSNVTMVNQDDRFRILSCIHSRLKRNADCNATATHLNGAFEIIRTTLMENHKTDPVPPIISKILNEALLWISKEPSASLASDSSKKKHLYDRERRLKQGLLFHKLIFVCKGEEDRSIVDEYRQGLDDRIKAIFGKELMKDNSAAGLRYPYLTRYMAWRQIQ